MGDYTFEVLSYMMAQDSFNTNIRPILERIAAIEQVPLINLKAFVEEMQERGLIRIKNYSVAVFESQRPVIAKLENKGIFELENFKRKNT